MRGSGSLVVLVGVMLGLAAPARAQKLQPVAPQNQALLSLHFRGAQKSLQDTVKGVLLEHDPPKAWDLLIIGSKGKGQFTCEVRSTDRQLLFDIQRTILFARGTSVNCANGLPSPRGGVIVDLDDPKGGSFILGADR